MSLDTESPTQTSSAAPATAPVTPPKPAAPTMAPMPRAAPMSTAPKPPPAAAPAVKSPTGPVTVYDHFIANEEDVVGQVAFAMYESERRDWLTSWRSQTGADPTHDHYSAFISSNMTQGQRQRYRSAARTALDHYYVNHFEGPSPNGDYRQSGRAEKAAQQQADRRRMWRNLGMAIGALAVLVVIIVGAYLALRYDLLGLFPPVAVR